MPRIKKVLPFEVNDIVKNNLQIVTLLRMMRAQRSQLPENKGKLKAVAVEGVEPSQATVDDGTYPISRPLFLYSDAVILKEKPQVAAFIYFYLSNVDKEISDVGYFPAPDKDLQASMDAWTAATK